MDINTAQIVSTIVIKKIINVIKPLLKKSSFELINYNNIETAINDNIKFSVNWCSTNQGLNLHNKKDLSETFIDLDYFFTSREQSIGNVPIKKKLIENIFLETNSHIVILGDGGTGKTTSMKMITKKMFFNDSFLKDYKFPLVFLFRNIQFNNPNTSRNDFTLTRYLINELGIEIVNKNDKLKEEPPIRLLKSVLYNSLDDLNSLILLDGFDEIPIYQQINVAKEINELSLNLNKSRIVLTSRTPNFKYFPEMFRKYEIAPLSDEQIINISTKWFGQEKGKSFFKKAKNSPFSDTFNKPLILTFIINLYLITDEVPDFPATLFQQILDILLYKWDFGRPGINRTSKYKNFNYTDKSDFLAQLSYELLKANKTNFTSNHLAEIYGRIKPYYPFLPKVSNEVIDELREHSGLIVKLSYDEYSFPHKSLQEYLAGLYIANYTPIDDIILSILNMPYETAMATLKVTNKTSFICYILKEISKNSVSNRDFIQIYFKKLKELDISFTPSIIFGYQIIRIYSVIFSGEQFSKNSVYFNFLSCGGVRESIKLVQKLYKHNPIILIKREERNNPNYLMKIEKRSFSKEGKEIKNFSRWKKDFEIPLNIIQGWKYL